MVLLVATARLLVATARLLVACAGDHKTALGVFFRFQVTDFDLCLGFFSLCHFIFSILFVWVGCSCVVFGDTEGHLMPALDVLFGNQVVEMNQFISCALAPFIS